MAELPSGTVTFLFTDVEGSTALWEEAPEAMRAALARHDALFEAAAKHDLRMIYLLAPTSTPERIKRVAELGSGFIYCVSVTGVTGARDELSEGLSQFVDRVRTCTDLPIAVGFGISQRKHFQSVGRIADGAVVGSAIIDAIDGADPSQAAARVKEYVEVVTGRRGAPA